MRFVQFCGQLREFDFVEAELKEEEEEIKEEKEEEELSPAFCLLLVVELNID